MPHLNNNQQNKYQPFNLDFTKLDEGNFIEFIDYIDYIYKNKKKNKFKISKQLQERLFKCTIKLDSLNKQEKPKLTFNETKCAVLWATYLALNDMKSSKIRKIYALVKNKGIEEMPYVKVMIDYDVARSSNKGERDSLSNFSKFINEYIIQIENDPETSIKRKKHAKLVKFLEAIVVYVKYYPQKNN